MNRMTSYGGVLIDEHGAREGYLIRGMDGMWHLSEHPKGEVVRCVILPRLVNAHTHCGDMFLRGDPTISHMSLADLVGPLGYKHRQLNSADEAKVVEGMRAFITEMRNSGVGFFVDFREQGVRGIRLLAEAVCDSDVSPVVLGRPVREDLSDLMAVLNIADGVGISSISDLSVETARAIARAVHSRRKILSLHLSEEEREDADSAVSLRPHLLIHCLECSHEDLRSIARKGIPVVVCPRASAFLGLNLDVEKMLESGITIMLGTDNAMISTPSVLEEAGFLVSEFDVSAETAVRLLINAKVLNQWVGILLKRPVTSGYVLVEGRGVEDVPGARTIALCTGGQMWRCDLER